MVIAICVFMLGVICGVLFMCFIIKRIKTHCSGTLRIDRSDEAPLLFLDLDDEISDISENETVTFQVENKDFLPRKRQSL